MRSIQYHRQSLPRAMSLQPARRTQTTLVALSQPQETDFRVRRRQIIFSGRMSTPDLFE